jgi:hypothetical protein
VMAQFFVYLRLDGIGTPPGIAEPPAARHREAPPPRPARSAAR